MNLGFLVLILNFGFMIYFQSFFLCCFSVALHYHVQFFRRFFILVVSHHVFVMFDFPFNFAKVCF